MNMRNAATWRYGSLTIALHWAMLVLIAAVYACIELHEVFPKGSEARAAWLGHGVLYAFMIVIPIMSWLTLGASGKVIPFFFSMELPALIGTNEGLGETIEDIHKTIGTAGYYLIALHAAAALYHHHVRRDNTLVRMLPMLDRRGRE